MRWATTISLLTLLLSSGCTRDKYFALADAEVDHLAAEKAGESIWVNDRLKVQTDPRSRYHDIYSPVRPPKPEDDHESSRYMREVNGYRGYKHWDRDGHRQFLDNPGWEEWFSTYCDVDEDGRILLSLPSSVSIARVNSPDIQRQVETVYLSALDVASERFEFDAQFFAGNDTTWSHLGRLRNPGVGEQNELVTDTDALIRRRFTTAGELLVGFANTFVWQFAGPDSNDTFSLINFALVQPLLRGAFRSIAMEDLTQSERNLLSNLRALERYYHGFLTNLAVGELGVLGPLRTPSDPNSFPGNADSSIRLETLAGQSGSQSSISPNRALTTGFVVSTGARLGGFLGLLQQYQEVRNSRQNLSAQERAVRLLEGHLAAGNIELIRVDEFRQNVEVERNNLLELQTRLDNSFDDYKVTRLGLPSDLEMVINDDFIAPVNLNSDQTLQLQQDSQALLDQMRFLIEDPQRVESDILVTELGRLLADAQSLIDELMENDEPAASMDSGDSGFMPAPIETAEDPASSTEAIEGVQQRSPREILVDLDQQLQQLRDSASSLEFAPNPTRSEMSQFSASVRRLAEIVDVIYLTEIGLRLERVRLEPVGLNSTDAFAIASLNRLDWMNARASVVDQWRQITLQANRLKSDLDIFVSGDVRTIGRNPVKFRGPTGTLRLGLRFDSALTRLLERNAFRESIVEYQRSRRDLIQFQDTIGQNLRRLIREMEQLRRSFEIQRRAVEIAVRRVDVSLQVMNRPPVPAPAGAPNNQLSPNASFSMLTALGDLRASKDNILSVWLNFQATKLLLARDLGVMGMDADSIWIDVRSPFFPESLPADFDCLPPEVVVEEVGAGAIPDGAQLLDEHTELGPLGMVSSDEAQDGAVKKVESAAIPANGASEP